MNLLMSERSFIEDKSDALIVSGVFGGAKPSHAFTPKPYRPVGLLSSFQVPRSCERGLVGAGV